ncbi:MAG TPA: tRNA (adenosine(37)-N6)-threonylcarbamoyltransferase complex ATPase subunit type 1 TsaE [Oceanospirillales bacterium]|nr:tRNA (adenosine(37)-N6)-threonylcarbamoyltransferase complex ATPase subunit type 1 TsaE [Oceanospirillales bacterium]
MKIDISSLSQLDTFAQSCSQELMPGDVIFLHGDLGSGKTTFTQLLLKHLNYQGRVKSPTYAIYECYQLKSFSLIHMDLYRLSSPEELYYLGIDEIFDAANVVIIEWPEKGRGVLPAANKTIHFELHNAQERSINIEIT